VNWGLWKAGGIQLSDEFKAILTAAHGMVPMDAARGLQSLVRCWGAKVGQVMVVDGEIAKLNQQLFAAPAPCGSQRLQRQRSSAPRSCVRRGGR